MGHQEDEQLLLPSRSPWGTWPILLMCLCIGAAVLHTNLLPRSWSTGNVEGPRSLGSYVGWPVVYGGRYPPLLGLLPNPEMEMQFHWVYVDLLVGTALVLSPVVPVRLRRLSYVRSTQFTLSGLFLLSTAVAMVFALSAMERAYGWARLTGPVEPSTYSALSAYPWYDQVLISLGLICVLYAGLAVSCQVAGLAVVKLRGLRKNRL